MFHDYVHVEMEVDNQPNIWVCSKRAIQRKQISRHLILFQTIPAKDMIVGRKLKIEKNTLFNFYLVKTYLVKIE